jgi:hypothetical protein
MKLLGINNADFDEIDQRLIKSLYPADNGENKWEYKCTVHQLFMHFKKVYDSVRREELYNILIKFGIPRKLGGLIKVRLNGTYIQRV